jgi:uncharacterized protein with GYD domain
MPQYMTQFTYTPEAWAVMAQAPQEPGKIVRSMVEVLGGSITAFYYSFGEYDGVVLYDTPDDVTAAAAAVAANAAGDLKAIKTTVLLSEDKGREMMRKVGGMNFSGPTT